jgi:plasmid maintenance system antidote protein VapI
MFGPPHPGRVVRQECIEALGLSVTLTAAALGGDPELRLRLQARRREAEITAGVRRLAPARAPA